MKGEPELLVLSELRSIDSGMKEVIVSTITFYSDIAGLAFIRIVYCMAGTICVQFDDIWAYSSQNVENST